MKIQPLSLVLGLAIAVVCMLTMSQLTVQPTRVDPYTPPCVMQVEYGPHARDMVQIKEGTPFVVPSRRTFVLTALGAVGANATNAYLFVNGTEEIATNALPPLRFTDVPVGFTAPAGATVHVTGSFNNGRAWGYLADE